jgi:glycosyltransferase involved in cell wall biosynthesis
MYPPHHLGGYELSCRDTVERWRRAGHEVHVLTTTMRLPETVDPPAERAQGVRRDLAFYWEDHRILNPSIRKRFMIERENHRILKRTLEEVAPDVVSVWHMGAMSLGLLQTVADRGIPMVLVVCDHWLVYGPQVDPWTRLFGKRARLGRLVRLVTGISAGLTRLPPETPVCFVSDWIRRVALEQSPLRFSTTTLVYSGVDLDDFPINRSPRPPWRWRLLCVGRQEERKGTHVAVEALKEMPEARLEIVGPGDTAYLDRLRTLADDFKDCVSFDNVPRELLHERYAAADVFLFPVTWDEPFGLVPIEAMAAGVPVVATGTGGSAEFLVDGTNCLIVAPDDAHGLAEAVGRLASDGELRERLVRGGWATAAELNVDRLAAVLERWHLAAASHFADGRPEDLPPPLADLRPTR